MISGPADRLRTSVGRLTTLLSYWTPPRFSAAASPLLADAVTALCAVQGPATGPPTDQAEGSVAEQLGRVVQLLADLGADAEGRRRRPVPQPPEPGSLADQLLVMSTDLLAAAAQASSTALLEPLTEHLDALREAL